ncbi:hypothetical protein H257_15067 [Aphanomyces astaci]|uniref:Uncharacterized protein n=1 Tax=Aphanomyces astaci TaxID=112090 RepID=W4FNP4_APHAT|nr:hypothetical protein H257_15067 [Aphanomyces astaci]ETV69097.1 hypothetical protein H257_15067 [Aphanomyces astaci]|eukprot:XP_009841350.1 hypothetical protein H257_15067 [Aphanomyces astaci]
MHEVVEGGKAQRVHEAFGKRQIFGTALQVRHRESDSSVVVQDTLRVRSGLNLEDPAEEFVGLRSTKFRDLEFDRLQPGGLCCSEVWSAYVRRSTLVALRASDYSKVRPWAAMVDSWLSKAA